MLSVKVPDIEKMKEPEKSKAIKQWMQSVNIQVRQELARLEKLITEVQRNGNK